MFTRVPSRLTAVKLATILVPRGRAPFGQHQESRPLAKSNTGSPRFTDFPSLCACSESRLKNLIGSDLNLLCLQSHSKTECRWTRPEVAILGADQKERGIWGREWLAMLAEQEKELPADHFSLLFVRDVTETNNLHTSNTTQVHKTPSNTTHKQSKQTENNQNCETLGLFILVSAENWITVMKNDRKC